MAEAKGIKSAEQSPVQLQTQMQVIDSVVSRIQASNQNLMNIQAETNHLLSTLNNNIIAISNNQKSDTLINHSQVLGELQNLTQSQINSYALNESICNALTTDNAILNQTQLLEKILCELKAQSESGELRIITGTATTTPVVHDFVLDIEPYHKIREVTIKNDGATTIYLSVGEPDTVHFLHVYTNESISIPFLTEVISKVIIKTTANTSAYRLWYKW